MRRPVALILGIKVPVFPFLLGGAFIEAREGRECRPRPSAEFPFLLGGAFIEAKCERGVGLKMGISLPSWRGFH